MRRRRRHGHRGRGHGCGRGQYNPYSVHCASATSPAGTRAELAKLATRGRGGNTSKNKDVRMVVWILFNEHMRKFRRRPNKKVKRKTDILTVESRLKELLVGYKSPEFCHAELVIYNHGCTINILVAIQYQWTFFLSWPVSLSRQKCCTGVETFEETTTVEVRE